MLFNASTLPSVCSLLVEAVVFAFPPAIVNEMEKTLGCLIQQSGTQGSLEVSEGIQT